MLTTHRSAKIVPLVLQCDKCRKFHHVAVRFEGSDAVMPKLPDNCVCGHPLDRPDVIRDCIVTARQLIANAPLLGGAA